MSMEVMKMNTGFNILDVAEFALITDVVKKENPEKYKRVEEFLSKNKASFFLKDRYPHGVAKREAPELVKKYFVAEETKEVKLFTFVIQVIGDRIVKLFPSLEDGLYYIPKAAGVLGVSSSSEKKEKKIGSDGVDISGDSPIKVERPDGSSLGELHWERGYIVGENLDANVKLIIKRTDGTEEVISSTEGYVEVEYPC